jgi:hypothetical protein
MSIAEKSALRWISHVKRLGELRAALGGRLLIVKYEDLCNQGVSQMQRVAEFAQVENLFSMPEVKTNSLYKKNQLNDNDFKQISLRIQNFMAENQMDYFLSLFVRQYIDGE